jgi:hypothetical protein
VDASPASSASRLLEIDPQSAMLIIQCSGAKRSGGWPGEASEIERWPAALVQARRRVLAAARADESMLLPAWRRYTGTFYEHAGAALAEAVAGGNVLIVSGGYGVLCADEPIGSYDKIFKLRDWPRGLLEHLLVEHARASHALAVVAFASASTDYAGLLRRTPWSDAGITAVLVTVTGVTMGAMGVVPRRLGQAFDCFWSRRPAEQYAAGITAEPLA